MAGHRGCPLSDKPRSPNAQTVAPGSIREPLDGAIIDVTVHFPGKSFDGSLSPKLRTEHKDLELFDVGRFLELQYTHPEKKTVHRRRVPWVHVRYLTPQGADGE